MNTPARDENGNSAVPDELQSLAQAVCKWLDLSGAHVAPAKVRSHVDERAAELAQARERPPRASIEVAATLMGLLEPRAVCVVLAEPELASLPVLCRHDEYGWIVVIARAHSGRWLAQTGDGHALSVRLDGVPCLHRIATLQADEAPATARALLREQFARHRGVFAEVALASLLLTVVGLFTSFYSMQVYDRVIPSQGFQTLIVLSVGVAFSIALEWLVKAARAHLLEPHLKQMDCAMSLAVFSRLMAVRLDARPPTVGTLASQLQGYEMIRGVLSASVLFMLFDLPMALVFIVVIGLIAGPWMALVPLVLFPLATALGLLRAVRLNRLVAASVVAGNRKTGMLVEAIEGAEPIKGLGAAWRFETRWAALVETNAVQSLQIKSIAEGAAYLAGGFQQLGYVALVALGAALTIEGSITQGAVIACSILSGRVLAPSSSIPGLLIQLAQARAALVGLEQVFALKTDNDGVERPIVPGVLHGQLRFEDVEFAYPGRPQAVAVKSLRIDAGEKVAIIGPVGAGKSTMLAMACGLIKPQRGTVYVDGIDAAQLSANWLGSHAAYTPQTPWLFSGTLRENLLMGQPDLGDEPIIDACRRTGLWSFIGQHPKGLDLPIAEGGRGLSGGQRQLVCLTRHLLAGKPLWLLDEPTSGMDDALEAHSVALLRSLLTPRHTMLLVTHRPALLGLVDRIVVLTQRGIALDGPRDQVLAQLAAPRQEAAPAAPALVA